MAWERALSADRPTVIDAIVDPDVPPLPPHVTLKQAKAFGLSMLKMDPEEAGVLKQAVQQIFPKLGKEKS
jgi:pyruvate dehydrogenase (quinone)